MLEIISELARVAWITLIPALELRASIPYGIMVANLHWLPVFIVAVIVNIALGVLVYFLLDEVVHLFFHIKWFHKLYHKTVERAQKKVHPFVEKYGTLGVALFIGIPLPGSGVYTGALGSFVLDLGYKKFIIASIVGVLIAAIVVTTIVLTGTGVYNIFVKV